MLRLRGDSESNFALLARLKTGLPVSAQLDRNAAVERMGEHLFCDGRIRAYSDLTDLFTCATNHTKEVEFLPLHRLMTSKERDDIMRILAEVVDTGQFTSGPFVARFEEQLAHFLGRGHVVGCCSGTDALIFALLAAGIVPGDEVIMPANSFAATENAALAIGAVPVLVDIQRDDWNIDPGLIEEKITPRTKVVMPVHLNGQRAAVKAIRDICAAHDLKLIEDCSQCIGLTGLGQHADLSILSFNPVKNLGVCGKGGAVVTDDNDLAEKCRSIAYHGFEAGIKNVKSEPYGFNGRLDNLQAAIGVARLAYLGLNNFKRLYLADRYISALADLVQKGRIALPRFADDHVWHLFPVEFSTGIDRNLVLSELRRLGVNADIFYPLPTHKQETPLRETLFRNVELPVTERRVAQLINLPLYANLSLAEQDRVVEAMHRVLRDM